MIDPPKFFAGCDPDLSTVPVAFVAENLTLLDVRVFRNEGKGVLALMESLRNYRLFCLAEAGAVESQVIYPKKPGVFQPPPNDILHLGQVAGFMVGALMRICWRVYFPTPAEWKGQIDKLPHHKRILTKAGVPENLWVQMGGRDPYIAVPSLSPPGVLDSDWKHITDAIGLAQYAAERYKSETLKSRYLQEARNG